jgi:hypothetical protein
MCDRMQMYNISEFVGVWDQDRNAAVERNTLSLKFRKRVEF